MQVNTTHNTHAFIAVGCPTLDPGEQRGVKGPQWRRAPDLQWLRYCTLVPLTSRREDASFFRNDAYQNIIWLWLKHMKY